MKKVSRFLLGILWAIITLLFALLLFQDINGTSLSSLIIFACAIIFMGITSVTLIFMAVETPLKTHDSSEKADVENNKNRTAKSIIITALCLTILGGISGYCLYNHAYETGYDQANENYDSGYDSGYSDGYNEGRDEGYNDGYSDGLYDSSESDMSGYLGPRDTYLTTDTAPSGTVWVTPSGEKYHEGWCRYISGRNDLTYYYSAEDAINAGYAPCSVCH